MGGPNLLTSDVIYQELLRIETRAGGASSDLSDFIGQVQTQTGKGITQSQVTQLIQAAQQIQAMLGC